MSRRAGHNGRPLLEVPMLLRGLTWLVLFQLLGTGLNVLLLPMLPGPIIGLVLLFGYFLARGEVGKPVNEAAGSLLRYLPLLLVPAAVGVMAYARRSPPISGPSSARWYCRCCCRSCSPAG